MILKLLLVAVAILVFLPLFRKLQKGQSKTEDHGIRVRQDNESHDPKPPPADDPAPASSRAPDFSLLMRTVVILDDNDWDACTVDGIKEEWGRYTAEKVRGFSTIPAGRHRAVTKIGDRVATLDFVIYPGDIFVRRLDRETATWEELSPEALAAVTRAADGGESGRLSEALVRYRSTFGIARVKAGKVPDPRAAFERAKGALSALLTDATKAGASGDLTARARAIGDDLVGVPLSKEQLGELTGAVRESAKGDHEKAILALGREVLPGDGALV